PVPFGPVNKFTMANLSFMYHIILKFSVPFTYVYYTLKPRREQLQKISFSGTLKSGLDLF
ncbi:hypothetical protein PZH44_16280, partial [Alistipes putredinis]|nr:hypothetical protein [Alistipes putredinis]